MAKPWRPASGQPCKVARVVNPPHAFEHQLCLGQFLPPGIGVTVAYFNENLLFVTNGGIRGWGLLEPLTDAEEALWRLGGNSG